MKWGIWWYVGMWVCWYVGMWYVVCWCWYVVMVIGIENQQCFGKVKNELKNKQ